MKFLLIGATGPTGEAIVKQGLAEGHDITALVRDASKVAVSDSHLRLVVGDILSAHHVDDAMAGQDAVICSLGTGVIQPHSPPVCASEGCDGGGAPVVGKSALSCRNTESACVTTRQHARCSAVFATSRKACGPIIYRKML